MSVIEQRYAKALLDALKSNEEKSNVNLELAEVSELFVGNNEFRKILLDPRIASNIKVDVIREIFSKNNPMFISFLGLLIDKNRIGCLDGISREYGKLIQAINSEINIKIVSATKLDEDEINGISDKYKKIYNAMSVKYDLDIDEDLLGGVKVIVGNKVYDGSLKTQLRNIL